MSLLDTALVLHPGGEAVREKPIIKVALCYGTSIASLLTLFASLVPVGKRIVGKSHLAVQVHLLAHLVHQSGSL